LREEISRIFCAPRFYKDEKYLLKRGFPGNWSKSRGILERTRI
jgi:hypothetical protein